MFATPRDIALIFLSLQALVGTLLLLLLVAAVAYGIYRLRLLVRDYLRLAFGYAEKLREGVERASDAIAAPFIKAYSGWRMFTTIINQLISRRAI